MSTSKHIDKICCIVLAFALVLTVLFMNAGSLGIQAVSAAVGYASRLFDTSKVHTIDIVMDDWDSFIEGCADEEYADCTVVIDGEAYRNVAIRAKGNTSLTSVQSYGNDRYSFKVEFDHYDDAGSYYGLDKLCLNNIIQDNTYMKDYLVYRMMREFGADAPLCSFSYITVNGEDWGLYLAVEGVEESFLQRTYGSDYGQLYKPDSMDMGGGRGNGHDFNMEDLDFGRSEDADGNASQGDIEGDDRAGSADRDMGGGEPPEFGDRGMGGGPSDHVMGSSDVSLIYTDDAFDSYENIFDSAKTDITDADKTRLIESLKKLNAREDIEEVVDIEEVLRYFVVHNFVLNFDSYTGSMIHNYYLYEDDGQFSMIPWDYNLAFGGFQSNSDATELVNYPIDTPVSGGTIDSRPMLAWIFADEKYTDYYHQYFSEFIAKYFDGGYLEKMIDSASAIIAPYVASDPTKFCTYEEFEKGVSALKDFCALRAESVSGQLDGTIPATSETQAEDSATLVDAGGITVADMGSMGRMGGGDFGGHGQRFETAEKNDADNGAPDFDVARGGMWRPGAEGEAVEAFRPMEGDSMPPGMPFDMPQDNRVNSAASYVPVGISAAVLLFAILAATRFRRRR